MQRKWLIFLGLVTAFLLLFSAPASATMVGFDCISNGACDSVQDQLSLEITDLGSDQVLFTVVNAGPILSSVAAIYWDDSAGVLLSIADLFPSAGVSFAVGGSPSDLPGGGSLTPQFNADFLVTADDPAPTFGINPGESLGVSFNMVMGTTFADILTAMTGPDLRVGLHVISIDGGPSASLVNTPIPEPMTFLLLGSGLLALGLIRRRVAKKK